MSGAVGNGLRDSSRDDARGLTLIEPLVATSLRAIVPSPSSFP
jgi:hypothetical protein